MQENADEKRTNPRFPCACGFSYVAMGDLNHPADNASVQGKILDISSSGMRIKVKEHSLNKGTIMIVKIPVFKMEAKVPTLAEVKWVKESQYGCQAGLRFVTE